MVKETPYGLRWAITVACISIVIALINPNYTIHVSATDGEYLEEVLNDDCEMGTAARKELEALEGTDFSVKCYTILDIELVAKIMWYEVGVFLAKYYEKEPEKVERAFKLTGSVFINRKKLHYGGAETLNDVLMAKGQYGTKDKVLNGEEEIPPIVYQWAEELLRDGTIGPDNLLYQNTDPTGTEYEKIYNTYFGTDYRY